MQRVRTSHRAVARPNMRRAWARIHDELTQIIDNAPTDSYWGDQNEAHYALDNLEVAIYRLYRSK